VTKISKLKPEELGLALKSNALNSNDSSQQATLQNNKNDNNNNNNSSLSEYSDSVLDVKTKKLNYSNAKKARRELRKEREAMKKEKKEREEAEREKRVLEENRYQRSNCAYDEENGEQNLDEIYANMHGDYNEEDEVGIFVGKETYKQSKRIQSKIDGIISVFLFQFHL
jgi:hypothetical protein